jgi:hypothetical protein
MVKIENINLNIFDYLKIWIMFIIYKIKTFIIKKCLRFIIIPYIFHFDIYFNFFYFLDIIKK